MPERAPSYCTTLPLACAVTECERFYPAFQHVIWAGKTPSEAIEAAVFETAGEA